jgi:hypothetical protein
MTFTIDTVYADHVSVQTAPLLDFYSGDVAAPAKHCTLDDMISLKRNTRDIGKFKIEVEEL